MSFAPLVVYIPDISVISVISVETLKSSLGERAEGPRAKGGDQVQRLASGPTSGGTSGGYFRGPASRSSAPFVVEITAISVDQRQMDGGSDLDLSGT